MNNSLSLIAAFIVLLVVVGLVLMFQELKRWLADLWSD
jgi:hypothetical protein